MKKNNLKLVPDTLPSLFKTIKRSYSPDPSHGYGINLDDLKTKKISIKDYCPSQINLSPLSNLSQNKKNKK